MWTRRRVAVCVWALPTRDAHTRQQTRDTMKASHGGVRQAGEGKKMGAKSNNTRLAEGAKGGGFAALFGTKSSASTAVGSSEAGAASASTAAASATSFSNICAVSLQLPAVSLLSLPVLHAL